MKFIATLALVGLCSWVGVADAQAVYRCGNTYSQSPCPDGKVVDATDARTAAQRAEARRVALDERRLAQEMERDRLAQQSAFKPAAASSLGPRPAPVAAPVDKRHAKKKRGARSPLTTDFVAVDPETLKRRRR